MRVSDSPARQRSVRPKSTPSASDSSGEKKESDHGARTFWTLALGAGGMACLLALLPAAGHDQMWCLYAANLILHGAKLYGPQLFESNPPLIFWLSAVPAAVANWLHVPTTAVGKLLLVGLEGGVAAVCFRLLKMLRPGMSKAAVYGLGFVFVTVFAVMPARDFGQRDHILALLCLPYLLAAALDAEGRPIVGWKAVCVGLAAGVGIALKPHQALIPVAVESVLLVLRRRRGVRPELVAIVACGVAYVTLVHYFAADYFTRFVPLLRDTYWAFGHLGWWGLVGEAVQLHILAAVTLVAWFVVGTKGPGLKPPMFERAYRLRPKAKTLGYQPAANPALVALLIVAGVASTIAYDVQGTGWYYQQLPALTFFTFALSFLAIDAAEMLRLTTPVWMPKAAGALCLLAVGLTAHFSGYPFTAARSFPIDTPDPTFFAGLAPGTPVATLTTTVDYTVPPVFKYGLTLAQRYPHLWMLPAILRSEDPQGEPLRRTLPPARVAELDAWQHAAMREDFARWQPRLVLVERCQDPAVHCQVLEDRHDDLLAWFLRDPEFRAEFAQYKYVRSVGVFDAYVPR